MAKFATFFTIALVLSFSLSCLARHDPMTAIHTEIKAQQANLAAEKAEACDGIGRDECLMRRTLLDEEQQIHTDYIYTGDTKN